MNWSIKISSGAERQLRKFDPITVKRLVTYLNNLVSEISHPRERGKALTGPYAGLWRFRVGDHRIICQIQDDQFVVLVIRFGHRSSVYR